MKNIFFLIVITLSIKSYSQDRITGELFSTRSEVIAENGMVATSHPLATNVGIDILKNGGNAIDAAIAANAAIGLMEPTGNGIGGDLFAIIWIEKDKKLYGLNASGRSPKNLTLDYFKNNSDIISAEILGYLRYPTEKKMFTPKNSPETNEWYYYDLQEIQKYFQTEINQKFFIKNMTNYSEEFLLPSTVNHNFSNNHLQYAITWFLMSFSDFLVCSDSFRIFLICC